jgi:hypothetical protein
LLEVETGIVWNWAARQHRQGSATRLRFGRGIGSWSGSESNKQPVLQNGVVGLPVWRWFAFESVSVYTVLCMLTVGRLIWWFPSRSGDLVGSSVKPIGGPTPNARNDVSECTS